MLNLLTGIVPMMVLLGLLYLAIMAAENWYQ